MILGALDLVGIFIVVLLAELIATVVGPLASQAIMTRLVARSGGGDLQGDTPGVTPPETGGAEFDVEE